MRKLRKGMVLIGRRGNRFPLIRHGVAASIEHDAVLRCKPWTLVVDVGANRGQFSLAVRHFRPQARIVAFEPLASAAAVYRKVFADDPRTELHQVAVACRKETVTMHRSGREDSSSLLPISELMPDLYPGTAEAGTETVATAPLTDFLSPSDLSGCALLKIDVQGFELEVIKSAAPLLDHFAGIYVEASFLPFYEGQPLLDEVISDLQARGFAVSGFMNPSFHTRTGMAVQTDLYLTPTATPRST